MKRASTFKVALWAGVVATLTGLIAFALNWNLYDLNGGPIFGADVLLYPSKLAFSYIWNPIFTKEVDFWPKLGLLLIGQFTVVALFVFVVRGFFNKFRKA